jgi:Uncharacterized membrane protein
MSNIGQWAVPMVVSIIIISGLVKNLPMFDIFINGAKDGLGASLSIAPSLIGLITAIGMIKASGALDIFTSFIAPIANKIGFPPEVVPLAILRPISGSGTIALLDNLFSEYGPDSNIGNIASIMMGATETTFYTAAVYLGAVGIKNSKYTIPSALIADLTTIILAVICVKGLLI